MKTDNFHINMMFRSERLSLCAAGVLLAVLSFYNVVRAETVTFDTTPYWPEVDGVVGGLGPVGPTTTMGESFVAPAGGSVALNDFTFYGQSYEGPNGGIATLYLQAFVFQLSGNVTTGNPLYLGSAFIYSPVPRADGWTPLTANLGPSGVDLIPNDVYMMGFTLSNPINYAASSGEVEFQNIPEITMPVSASGGGGGWNLNNGNDFSELTNSTWGGGAPLSFTAHLTLIPEGSEFCFLAPGSLLLFVVVASGVRRLDRFRPRKE
jgi:hypothetical protein